MHQHPTPDSTAPPPAAVAHLRAHDGWGWAYFAITSAASAAGLALSRRGGPAAWVLGQVVLAAALVEWFVLLHECGHGTLFASRRLNLVAGRVAGFFALIPFPVWTRVHGRHHKWTGWQDVDPTTESLARTDRSAFERRLVNICWRCWIPLFSVLYRWGNFWNLPRLLELFPAPGDRRRLAASAARLAAVYAAVIWLAGPLELLRLTGGALLLSLIVQDLLLISQHTHVPMARAEGRPVQPFKAVAQEAFTRSVRLPALASRLALHVDAHELHHMYPFVPGYRLGEIPYTPANEVSWRRWVPAARAVPGEVLLFQNRHESGLDL